MDSQKKIRQHVDIIDVYGINAFGLTKTECNLLHKDIPRVIANREMRTRMCEIPISSDRLYELILVTTGSEEKAEEAKTNYIMAKMKTGNEVT